MNYRKPVFVGKTVLVTCALDRVEKQRKRYLKGVMTDAATGAVLADAEALYLIPRGAG